MSRRSLFLQVLRTLDNSDPQNPVGFNKRISGGRFSVGDAVQLAGRVAIESLWNPGTIVLNRDGTSQSALDSGGGVSPAAPRARLVDGRVVRITMTVRSSLFGGGGDSSAATPGATTHEAVRVQATDTAAPGGADPHACAKVEVDGARGDAEYRGWNDIEALGRRGKSLSRALGSTEDGIGKARCA